MAVVELMITNARIADLIREGKPEEITDAIAEGDYFGMQTFQQALIDAVARGEVDREVAANAASNRHDFLVALERELKLLAAAASQEAPDPVEPQVEVPATAEPVGLRVARPVAR